MKLDFKQLLYIGLPKAYTKDLIEVITFLIKNCYFTIENMVFKQDTGIPMGIDPAPFCANLLLYFFESNHIQNLITKKSTRAYK